jgi:hypothetical protein
VSAWLEWNRPMSQCSMGGAGGISMGPVPVWMRPLASLGSERAIEPSRSSLSFPASRRCGVRKRRPSCADDPPRWCPSRRDGSRHESGVPGHRPQRARHRCRSSVRLLVDRRCRSFVDPATFTLRVAAGSRDTSTWTVHRYPISSHQSPRSVLLASTLSRSDRGMPAVRPGALSLFERPSARGEPSRASPSPAGTAAERESRARRSRDVTSSSTSFARA